MTLSAHKIWHLPLLLLAFWLGGCAMQQDLEAPADEGSVNRAGDLYLLLDVYTGNPGNGNTRADEFEQAILSTELMRTLRILIVDKQPGSATENRIIHNYFEYFSDVVDHRSGLEFNINFNTGYKVYLIANEQGLSADLQHALSSLERGDTYQNGFLENALFSSSAPGEPLIDNSVAGNDKSYIPITEIFDIDPVDRSEWKGEDEKLTVKKDMFVTRSTSKFSFYFFKGKDLSSEDQESPDWEIKKVRIAGLGKDEYVFPNNTTYNPPKSFDIRTDRDIIGFTLPAESRGDTNIVGDYYFSLPQSLRVADLPEKPTGFNPNRPAVGISNPVLFAPEIYFPESKGDGGYGNKLRCSISFDGTNYLKAVELPNLPYGLPRNTHVVIIITVNGNTLEAEVKPYTVVDLEPEFGISTETGD